jgi:predicted ATP-binding protein involved in virulence
MRIKRLNVAGLRAFKQAGFEFRAGMNLLVGVNGVGKTTVLDALCICLSKLLPQVTSSRSRPMSFSGEDIRVKSRALSVNCVFDLEGNEITFLAHKPRETHVAHKPGIVREQTLETPEREKWQPPFFTSPHYVPPSREQPLGLFFSTRRSLISETARSMTSAAGGQAAAFADALSNRELRLVEMAYWMKAQEELGVEHPLALKHVAALRRAAKQFLPECRNLRAEIEPKPRLIIEKQRTALDVRQLSDGERGLLALVLDLAKRLSQANPSLTDPVKQGEAVVLIDELDLHLHPKWQRTIVESLTNTFPKCQFISTTHSPQIVAAVEPEQVLLLTDTGVIRPDRTLGMDSNWILRHLMEADDRPIGSAKAIREVEEFIKKGAFNKARSSIASKRKEGLDLPEWSILEARMARMELLVK